MFKLFKKKDDEELDDWRNLNMLPKEVISKDELDDLQKEVLNEIESIQSEAINESDEIRSAKPQTLFYYHKYIDSKFNKSDFDVDRYFMRKQNIIDQRYAEGLGELKAEFTGYGELLNDIRAVDQRLRRKINKLDPTSNIDLDIVGTYDDSAEILEAVNSVPDGIDWNKYDQEVQ